MMFPMRSRKPLISWASPRQSANSWRASARSTNRRWSITRSRSTWKLKGVIFLSIEDGLRQHPDLFREYFGTVIPIEDNKFAALNGAVWSGGSFIYIPKGVKVDLPLQAYFRLNVANIGQFERTLIIADEGAQLHYVEGCTAPIYTTNSLHSGVIEIVVKKNARVRYTTIQNWSTNVYNLVTQRALVYEGGTMEWVDANLGSKLTMKYPSCYLLGPGAHGEILSMAFAGTGQHQDAGGKVIHFAPHTSSKITSKSISKGGGRASYRGLLKVYKEAEDVALQRGLRRLAARRPLPLGYLPLHRDR